MYVEFERMPPNSSVWVYQSERELTDSELSDINAKLLNFVSGWNSHGTDLYSSFQIFYNRFIVLATNEDVYAASGCSIDKSVNAVKEIGKTFNVDFFNRGLIVYKQNEFQVSISLSDFKEKLKTAQISSETLFFNNTVSTISELNNNWIVPVNKSWLGQILKLS